MSRPKLHVLLVGINSYQHYPTAPRSIRPLSGCINDVMRMKVFLEHTYTQGQFQFNPSEDIILLTNEQATKAAILSALEKIGEDAQTGDRFLFSYSGHGFREKTNLSTFQEDEFDGHLASITTFDCNPYLYRDGSLNTSGISDKELRYYIRNIAHHPDGSDKAQVITLFDCCHSGENTRSLVPASANPSEPQSRKIQQRPFPKRKADWFQFGTPQSTQHILQAANLGERLASILPEGKHIQMAACKEIELAFEVPQGNPQGGAFTTALLDILETSKGNISYDELYKRVKNRTNSYTRIMQKAQSPQLYFPPTHEAARYQNFLTHAPSETVLQSNVVYNPSEQEWRITAGALRGVPIDAPQRDLTVVIHERGGQASVAEARIKAVFPDFCHLELPDSSLGVQDKLYYGRIPGLGINPIPIFLSSEDDADDQQVQSQLHTALNSHLQRIESPYFQIAQDPHAALLHLHIKGNKLDLFYAFDLERPITAPIKLAGATGSLTAAAIEKIKQHLFHIATWTFRKELSYQESKKIPKDACMFPVELRMYLLEEEEETGTLRERLVRPTKGKFTFDLSDEPTMGKLNPTERFFRMEIVNLSEKPYHCSLLYMTNLFKISHRFMPQAQSLLENSGNQVASSVGTDITIQENGRAVTRKYIRFHLDNERYVQEFNWPSISYYLKMVISQTPFDITEWEMPALLPPKRFIDRELMDEGKDALDFGTEIPDVQWEIYTFELEIQNPYFEDKEDEIVERR